MCWCERGEERNERVREKGEKKGGDRQRRGKGWEERVINIKFLFHLRLLLIAK